MLGAALSIALAGLVPVATPAFAAAPSPAWRLTATSLPSNFAAGVNGDAFAGPLYFLAATNVGGAATSGTVIVQATLPEGVTPVTADGRDGDPGSPDPACSISLQLVTCSTVGPLQSSRGLEVAIAVDVATDASGLLSAEATVSGGGAPAATAVAQTPITAEPPDFGFLPGPEGLAGMLTEADGSPTTQAGSHPYQLTIDLGFPSEQLEFPSELGNAGHPRDIVTDLPAGLVVNPRATPVLCTEAEMEAFSCPPASQIGAVSLISTITGLRRYSQPLYNMPSPPGSASNFGFDAGGAGLPVHLLGSVRSGDYGLSASVEDILAQYPILGMQIQLWGDPSSPSHDAARGVSVTPRPRPLLTMPSVCGPLTLTARVDSWEEPGVFSQRSSRSQDINGDPVDVSGCDVLDFSPAVEARPTTDVADSPSGLQFNLTIPQVDSPVAPASAQLKRLAIALPEGLVANPSGANGLTGCSPAQVGLSAPVGSALPSFDSEPAGCPDAAKIGAVEISTPLLEYPLRGAVYVAAPYDNPFDSLLALYVVVDDPRSGLVLKLPGKVEPDPSTGRLTAVFDEAPRLPFAKFQLRLFDGAKAVLRTPATCGSYATTSSLTPWSRPERTPPGTLSGASQISLGPNDSACAKRETDLPHAPSFGAGSISPVAGAYTPFVLKVNREDGSQHLDRLDLTLPPGLTGSLAGVGLCSAAAIAAIEERADTTRRPSCPLGSEIGGVEVAAGAGSQPLRLGGQAFLTGPYRGAPLGLAIVVPALAGPFDLGPIVTRAAVFVDRTTAQLRVVSDPLPAIRSGIPIDLRSLSIALDRPRFTRNPTNCGPMAVRGEAISAPGQTAGLSNRFQVGGCGDLGFKPKLSLRLLGPAHRNGHPRLRVALKGRQGDAAIRRVGLTLPSTELLESRQIHETCARTWFEAHSCPSSSLVGYAKVWSPLLDKPLAGPVYLRSSDRRLPGLAVSLSGQVDFDLTGRIESVHGRLRVTFAALPDARLSKLVLSMRGGKKGLLVNTGGLCAGEARASADFEGHNGKLHRSHPLVKTDCGKRLSPSRVTTTQMPGPT